MPSGAALPPAQVAQSVSKSIAAIDAAESGDKLGIIRGRLTVPNRDDHSPGDIFATNSRRLQKTVGGRTTGKQVVQPRCHPLLSHRAFHLQFDQAIHFDGVFHGKLADERFDKAIHNHGAGLRLVQAAAAHIKQLLFADA